MSIRSRHARGRPSRRGFLPEVSDLEPRTLLSSMPTAPTADEQYMLQLVNQARANPAADAQQLVALAQTDPVLKQATQGWDLSAFVKEMSSFSPEPPLAFDTGLIAASLDHDSAMLAQNDQFHSPTGFLVSGASGLVAGNGQPYYPVPSGDAWSTGENVFAFSSNVNSSSMTNYDNYFNAAFLIDWGNSDFGHLKNLLQPGPAEASATGSLPYSEIGIGLLSGTPTTAPAANPENAANKGLNVGPVLVTEEFAWHAGNAFLTGAVYDDTDGNNFYTPGEGLGGVTVVAVGLAGQGTFQTTTWDSGGYSLSLPAGSYAVTVGGANAPAKSEMITIGQDNVAWNVQYSAATLADTPVLGDFDGDGKDDQAVYRPSTAQWFILGSSSGPQVITFGEPNLDIPVPGDYDGVGHTEIAVYRPTTAQWFILGPNGAYVRQFGTPGLDTPVPGDYDGVGHTELAVYSAATAQWTIDSPSGPRVVSFGEPNADVPVPADYDGDGKTDIAVYRPTTAQWFILGTTSGPHAVTFGQPNVDVPVPADYDGDGKADIAVYRPTSAQWLVLGTSTGAREVDLGQAGTDIPVPADYDGDHSTDFATFTPSTARWTFLDSTDGAHSSYLGQAGANPATPAPSSAAPATVAAPSIPSATPAVATASVAAAPATPAKSSRLRRKVVAATVRRSKR